MPTNFYRQCDADYRLLIPAEGYGGWEKKNLDFDTDRSAVVIMHACSCGTYDECPGWYRAVEYLPRADKIAREEFPKLLKAIRNAGIRVFHVAFSGDYYQGLAGYKKTLQLAGEKNHQVEKTELDPVTERLLKFKNDNVYPGINNMKDISNGSKKLDFYPEARPLDSEEIVDDEFQLFILCKEYNINHLIYTGFAIDGCLLTSNGGMVDMARRGILCSTIRQAVTAIENKETARYELCKEIALWRVAVMFGFVYELDDFIDVIEKIHPL